MTGNVLLRQAQHCAVDSAAFTPEAARALVAGKLKNQRHVLLRGARKAKLPPGEAHLSAHAWIETQNCDNVAPGNRLQSDSAST